jgi:hypothetical protein
MDIAIEDRRRFLPSFFVSQTAWCSEVEERVVVGKLFENISATQVRLEEARGEDQR